MLTPTSGKNMSPRHVIISEARITVIYRVPRDRSDRGWPEAGAAGGGGRRRGGPEGPRRRLRGPAPPPPRRPPPPPPPPAPPRRPPGNAPPPPARGRSFFCSPCRV